MHRPFSNREQYTPGPASGAQVRKDRGQNGEDKWTLIRGGFDMRWELEALGGGTRLTLSANIGHRFISVGAAGWHTCFDVLDRLLAG